VDHRASNPAFDEQVETQRNILATRTTTQLLGALHEADNEPVWEQIDRRYRPVLAALARRLGLADADAEEVAQQTLAEFIRAYRAGSYDRTKGRLSSWLMGIAHKTSLAAMRDKAKHAGATLDGVPAELDEPQLRSIWNEERDREMLVQALALLRDDSSIQERTMQAFELVALRAVPASEVAAQLGISTDQVYVARSRVTRRLREVVQKLTGSFEDDT